MYKRSCLPYSLLPASHLTIAMRTVLLAPEDRGEFIYQYFLTATLLLDHVVDGDALRASLVALLREEGWDKLAARLRHNKDNQLEHVFTPGTVTNPVNFTISTLGGRRGDHALASRLLTHSSSPTPSFHPPLSQFRALFQHPDCCYALSDLLARGDYPPCSVHLTIFDDATCLGLTIPHVLSDIDTLGILLRAWPDKNPTEPVYEIGKSPLDVVDAMVDDGRPAGGQRPTKGWTTFRLSMTYMMDLLWNGMKEEERVIHVPKEVLARLRAEADKELDVAKGEWVSEHDLLMVWALKTLAVGVKPSSTGEYAFLANASVRKWVPDLFRSTTFLDNATSNLTTSFPARSLSTPSTTQLALLVRACIHTCCTPPTEVLRYMCMVRTYLRAADGSTVLFRPYPNLNTSSWVATRLGQVTENVAWGGAFMDGERRGFVPPRRFVLIVIAKGSDAGYWLSTFKPPKVWKEIERNFAAAEQQQAAATRTG